MTCLQTVSDLEPLALAAGRSLERAPADEIVRWAAETFGPRFALTSSMADAVVIDIASRVAPGTDVLFIDTGYHFAETLAMRDAVAARYDVNVVTLTPGQTVSEQDAAHGASLFERNPDLCCALRKVAPLDEALAGYDAWASGLRRDELLTRARTPVVAWDPRRGKVKVNPIARWTKDDVERYVVARDVLENPLLRDGFASIGCAPCTRRVGNGEDSRSGRWAGLDKTECGIHG